MENDRPSLDMKFFDAVCPDKNGMCGIVSNMGLIQHGMESACDCSVHQVWPIQMWCQDKAGRQT